MFLFKKHLDRRTFLRGMGATVALPLLDAMIPARALLAAMRPTQRLAFVYFPHGAVMDEWIPPAAGRALELGRILQPLALFRDRLTVIGGIENRYAYGPVHAITPGTWLCGLSPREKSDPSTRLGASGMHGATADQLAAEYLGPQSPVLGPRSGVLALAAEEPKKISAGIWEGQFDESLATTLSFRRGRVPVPMESSPRMAFDTLFGCDSVSEPRDSSVLDRIAAATASLRTRLGAADRAVLGDYLEAVRDAERRVHLRSESYGGQVSDEASRGDVEQQFIERLTLMFDLTALAFRADITRVASVMMAAEATSMTYGHVGAPESFHLLSHHQNDPENLEKLVRIQTFHTRMFARFIQTLAELPDGDGSLLDRSQILFGSNMSNSHLHDHFPLPLALVGGCGGTLHAGERLEYPERTPMSKVLRGVLGRAGLEALAHVDC
jgi:Protein of unknown function (DUF1552)